MFIPEHMQKSLNILTAVTFVIAVCNAAVIVMAFTRGPSMVKKYISDIKLELTEALTQMVPGEIEEALPELPTSTGPAIPFGR